jgi:uncharacterized membrane protein YgdD (TMEM256/DUF423 family)
MTVETCSNCGAALSPDLDWCGRCLTHVPRAHATAAVVLPDLDRSRALLAERILLTGLLVAFGIFAYVALVPVVDEVGTTVWSTVAFFLGLYTALGLVALWLSWRPKPRRARPAERELLTAGTVVRVPDLAEGQPQA